MNPAADVVSGGLGIKILFIGESRSNKAHAIEVISGKRLQSVEIASVAGLSELPRHEDAKFSLAVWDIGYQALACFVTMPAMPGLGRAFLKQCPEGVLGAVLLISSKSVALMAELNSLLEEYESLARQGAVVVGVTDLASESRVDLGCYRAAIAQAGYCLPVFAVDVLRKSEVLRLIEALLANAEVDAAIEGDGDPRRIPVGTSIRIPVDAMQWRAETARVVRTRGQVSVLRAGTAARTALLQDDLLAEGDTVRVGPDSLAALALGDGSIVHLEADTSLRMSSLRKLTATGANRTSFHLDQGRVDSAVAPVPPSGRFNVVTPLAVAGVRGTRFGVAVRDDSAVALDVLEGAVGFGTPGANARVTAETGAIATPARAGRVPEVRALLAPPDLGAVPALHERPMLTISLPDLPAGAAVQAQVATDPGMLDVLQSKMVPEQPIKFAGLDDGDYYLSVRVADANGLMGRRAVAPIRLRARPEPPWPYAPRSGTRVALAGTTLICTNVQGASAYDMQLSRTPGFEEIEAQAPAQEACRWELPALKEGHYFWRAATLARDAKGQTAHGPYGDAGDFVVVAAPAAPELQISEPGIETPSTANVSWAGETGLRYELQIAEDPGFTLNLKTLNLDVPHAQIELAPCRELFMRLRSVDANGMTSDFSVSRRLNAAAMLCSDDGTAVRSSGGAPIETR